MIQDFKNWKMFENLGTGIETFDEKLECMTGLRNLSIDGFKESWGELSQAEGTLKYRVELEVKRSGLDSIYFYLTDIILEIETLVYPEGSDDGETKQIEFVITQDMINADNVDYEVHSFPLYLSELTIDFSEVEDINDKEQLKKLTYSFTVGNEKND